MKFKILVQLFLSFFKIGLTAFGGGYAVIPLLQREAVEHRKWLTSEDLTDIMAISQTLPGAIYVNASTMLGYKVFGFWGALIATTAAVIPTFTIILLIVVLFWNYTDNPIVKKAFTGALLGITALVITSIVKMWSTSVKSILGIILVIISSVLLIVLKVNVVFVIIGITVISFSWNVLNLKRKGRKI
jgi:chromate transporter